MVIAVPPECVRNGDAFVLTKPSREQVRHMKYNYTRVAEKGSIRLLKRIRMDPYCPSFDHFQIREYPLDDLTPKYVPLSYVCGDSPIDMPIIIGDGVQVNGHICLVRKSAWQVLMAMCTYEYPVWIDQICIDQDDREEKQEQIELMGTIYASERRYTTGVWLGSASAETARAYNLIESLNRVFPPNTATWLADDPISHAQAVNMPHEQVTRRVQGRFPTYTPPPDNDPVWLSLADVIARSWFTRMWTFQEVVLTEFDSVSIVCGHNETSYRTTLRRLIIASMLLGLKQYPEYNDAMRENRHALYIIDSTARARMLSRPLPLHLLLDITADRQCMDPKDKIYALKHVQANTLLTHHITANYRPSDARVYADTTVEIAAFESSLLIMISASGRVGGRVNGLPSWVPDYTGKTLAPVFEAINPDSPLFSACRGLRWRNMGGQTTGSLEWSHMLVRGRRVDVFDTLDGNVMPASAGGDQMYAHFRQVFPNLLSQAQRTVHTDTEINLMLRIARTVTANGYSAHLHPLRRFSFVQNPVHRSYWRPHPSSEEEQNDLRMLQHLFSPSAPPFNAASAPQADADWLMAFNAQSILCKGRRFAFLKNWGLGLVPEQTTKDDFVAILHGSSVPVVLRHGKEEGFYQLVGPCYVDSIMRGEALDWREEEADSFVLV